MLRRRGDSRRVRAFSRGIEQLRVVFQPIYDLETQGAVGYEALSRFPVGSPDKWFSEAHAVGRGLELEMRAVGAALALRDHISGYLSVNVSPLSLVAPRFIEFIAGISEPGSLVLELTEHTPVGDYDTLCLALRELRDSGVRIAVDDAGGGVSSFRHILMVAPEIIKLDRSLIAGLDNHPGRQALADLLVQFARRTGADLVAEGIERQQELEACCHHGIRFGQGYLLGVPSPIASTHASTPSKHPARAGGSSSRNAGPPRHTLGSG